ncbi:MAG: S8 family serine peptidase [Acidobacteriota bacterium]
MAGELRNLAPDLRKGESSHDLRRALGDATGRGVRICLIDSGRDPDWDEPRIHPGLGLADPRQPFLVAPSNDDRDRIGHGTACADLLLRMAPGVEILPCRVFGHTLETSIDLLIAGLKWAASKEADIVNLSLGTTQDTSIRRLYQACEVLRRRGILVVSAIEQQQGYSYPAAFENAIGVRAVRGDDDLTYWYCPDEAAECVARGDGEVRWLEGERRDVFASSFAAPRISALLACFRERFPGIQLEATRELLARYASPETPAS